MIFETIILRDTVLTNYTPNISQAGVTDITLSDHQLTLNTEQGKQN